MATIVDVVAASHAPAMLLQPQAITSEGRDDIFGALLELGRALAEGRPQALLVITTDHLQNFFLDNLPAICIGRATEYTSPVEPWMPLEQRSLPGDAELGTYLLEHALASGFDPAGSQHLELDHGSLTPLHLAGVDPQLPLVPIVVNAVQPPLPTMRRCFEWGQEIGSALRAYPGLERVAVLATGGLSHAVGTAQMGRLDEAFDRQFLSLLSDADPTALLSFSQAKATAAGNGTEEVRNWLVARGVAGEAPLTVCHYRPEPAWYTGIGVARWTMSSSNRL